MISTQFPWQKVGTDLFTWNFSQETHSIPNVAKLSSETSEDIMKSIFARHSIPQEV